MAATLQIQDDSSVPITQWPFGIIDGGDNAQYKFKLVNVGADTASNIILSLSAVNNNDGSDFIQFAPDSNGNPGTYTVNDIAVGSLAEDEEYIFWVKVTVPSNASANGNPRIFDISFTYSGI